MNLGEKKERKRKLAIWLALDEINLQKWSMVVKFEQGSDYYQKIIKMLISGVNPTNRERNVLFNDALNTFYLRLYGVRHMVKDHSDSERGNLLPPLHGLF